MREYGKVYTAFWTSEDVSVMTEDERTLALYLLTCPHGNMLGCYRLPSAYVSDDLKWTPERVSKGFGGLASKGYIYRCDRAIWVVILRYMKWNQFENPNVGKAAGKLFNSLLAPHEAKSLLVKALREYSPTFPASILDKFEAEPKPFGNPLVLSPETGAVAVAVTGAPAVAATEAGTNPVVEQKQLDPVQGIFAYWQKVMKSPGSALDSKRRAVIVKALAKYSPADVCKAIRGCSRTPHNMGQNDRKTKYNSIGLILRDADHIDRFILNDAGNAKVAPGSESIEETNRRVMAEMLGDDPEFDVIEMED
jgi:hypothetical protein